MAFAMVALAPAMAMQPFRALHQPTLAKQGVGLLSVGAFFAINVG